MPDFKKENIIVSWLYWHFYEMPKFLLFIWGNYISFILYFFSIPLLLSTLFSPWRKYKWSYPRGFDLWGYYSTFLSNVFSRLIGALCRLAVIVSGIVTLLLAFLVGLLATLLWLFLPFLEIFLIIILIYV